MGLYSQGLYYTEQGRKILYDALQRMDIFHLSDESVNQISQGERQRVFIARALVSQAPILAFDEPTANADKKYQALIWQLMQELISQNKTVLMATHDLKNSRDFLSSALALDQGHLIPADQYQP